MVEVRSMPPIVIAIIALKCGFNRVLICLQQSSWYPLLSRGLTQHIGFKGSGASS